MLFTIERLDFISTSPVFLLLYSEVADCDLGSELYCQQWNSKSRGKIPEVWKRYELPACLLDQCLYMCVQLVSKLLLVLTNSVGSHLQDRSCSWCWVMSSPWELLREDWWMAEEIKNTREVDGNLPVSIPPVTIVSSPQQRLVELKVMLLPYWKWWTLLTLGKTQVWRWW